MQKASIQLLIPTFIILIFVAFSCRKDMIFEGDKPNFELTTDTVRFDTVFTSRGSATRFFKIKNEESESILVDVSLGKMSSVFRMNVDGIPTEEANEVEVLPEDSIYVFVEVTIDPDQPLSVSPFIVEDFILVRSKMTTDTVHLEAYGQNANYIPGGQGTGLISLLSCNMGTITWDDPKPYVVNGLLVVDSCTLIWPEGMRLYVHGGFANNEIGIYNDGIILFQSKGKLISQGVPGNEVIVEGDRLESAFNDVPGQWNGIRFVGQSEGNLIEYTQIRNAGIGLFVDSLSELTIKNSSVLNSSSANLIAQHSSVNAENTVFGEAGEICMQLRYGGDYSFDYCTIANSGGKSNQALYLSNNFLYRNAQQEFAIENPLNLSLRNSIIYSRQKEAFILDELEETESLNYSLDHCAYNQTELIEDNPEFLDNCNECVEIMSSENLFTDPGNLNYRPDTLSQVEEFARPIEITIDRDNEMRDMNMPDIGAYEFVPEM